jgi:hypothetical protein
MILKSSHNCGKLLAVLCLAMFAYAACSRQAKVPASPFPASNQVVGWVKTGDTRTFSATELWNYIDGEAERYVKAGVQTTSTADYNFQKKFDAVVDVYAMSSTAGARTILESEPAGETKSAHIGDRGRSYTGSLVFSKGRYLVRIVAYKQAPEVQPALLELGREIERRVSQ